MPATLALAAALLALARGADPGDSGAPAAGEAAAERAAVHFQSTVAVQAHPAFAARYSGPHSLRPDAESATSIVTDLFLAARPWEGAELHLEPELAGGRGVSSTLGVAAFPSGEVYRVGDPAPAVVLARAFLRQTVGLGGGRERVPGDPANLAGARDRDRLTFTVGKMSVPDLFDAVPAASDPHLRFESWGLFASAAYDYPADTRGYTWGAAAELALGPWSARGGLFLVPRSANGMELEWRVGRARGLAAEVERRFVLLGRAAAVRALAFVNTARMGSYRDALGRGGPPDVVATRAEGRTKAGFAASADADVGGGLSAFARASWNDGRAESWAFTEIDGSLALGAVQSGARWGRGGDEVGLAAVASGLSPDHRRYLAAGGLGFILGDGRLRYRPELLAELYYRLELRREVALVGTYQPVVNPGMNADRGPAHVFTARARVAF